ncbi:MAG: sugar phosphate isomerase/epimerase [Anaerolineae bacterium]|nr:sugar phosphate isomerase/epimerase [Anaerolineae bacterium]
MPDTRDTVFTLSGFGDEISSDLDQQLDALRGMGIQHLELRGVWGKNVVDLTDTEVNRVKRALADRGMSVSAIGSPIGKVPVGAPLEPHLEDLRRVLEIAHHLDTQLVRVFSFYVKPGEHERQRPEVLGRMEALVRLCEGSGVTLAHENEKEIYGDTPERCADILRHVDSPSLRAVFDPANFVQVGVARPFDRAWPLLGDYVLYAHIKDALLDSGQVVPAGRGDGQVPSLLQALKDRGRPCFLSLEPHLVFAGSTQGFSGEALFRQAAEALLSLIARLD